MSTPPRSGSRCIVDFHAHIFPDPLSGWTDLIPEALSQALPSRASFRRLVRSAVLNPVGRSLHRAQPVLRHLPPGVKHAADELSGALSIPGLLFESTPQDLLERMDEAGVERAVVIAHPPFMPNEFVLEAAQENPRFIPAVNLAQGTARPAVALGRFAARGARFLKIHAAADGETPESPRYAALLKKAGDLGLPVIVHTGCVHSHLVSRDPEQGDPRRFASWFKKYPRTPFILAHMGYHEPHVALEVAAGFENVSVDTSWQPAEIIGEAVRQLGADRVLYATDWPFVGNNLKIGIERVEEAVRSASISREEADKVLGLNAERLVNENPSRATASPSDTEES